MKLSNIMTHETLFRKWFRDNNIPVHNKPVLAIIEYIAANFSAMIESGLLDYSAEDAGKLQAAIDDAGAAPFAEVIHRKLSAGYEKPEPYNIKNVQLSEITSDNVEEIIARGELNVFHLCKENGIPFTNENDAFENLVQGAPRVAENMVKVNNEYTLATQFVESDAKDYGIDPMRYNNINQILDALQIRKSAVKDGVSIYLDDMDFSTKSKSDLDSVANRHAENQYASGGEKWKTYNSNMADVIQEFLDTHQQIFYSGEAGNYFDNGELIYIEAGEPTSNYPYAYKWGKKAATKLAHMRYRVSDEGNTINAFNEFMAQPDVEKIFSNYFKSLNLVTLKEINVAKFYHRICTKYGDTIEATLKILDDTWYTRIESFHNPIILSIAQNNTEWPATNRIVTNYFMLRDTAKQDEGILRLLHSTLNFLKRGGFMEFIVNYAATLSAPPTKTEVAEYIAQFKKDATPTERAIVTKFDSGDGYMSFVVQSDKQSVSILYKYGSNGRNYVSVSVNNAAKRSKLAGKYYTDFDTAIDSYKNANVRAAISEAKRQAEIYLDGGKVETGEVPVEEKLEPSAEKSQIEVVYADFDVISIKLTVSNGSIIVSKKTSDSIHIKSATETDPRKLGKEFYYKEDAVNNYKRPQVKKMILDAYEYFGEYPQVGVVKIFDNMDCEVEGIGKMPLHEFIKLAWNKRLSFGTTKYAAHFGEGAYIKTEHDKMSREQFEQFRRDIRKEIAVYDSAYMMILVDADSEREILEQAGDILDVSDLCFEITTWHQIKKFKNPPVFLGNEITVTKLPEPETLNVAANIEGAADSDMSTIGVGDVLYSSWGYDQTNVDFYKVLRRTKSMAEIIQIETVHNFTHGYSGTATPADVVTGAPMKLRLSSGNSVKVGHRRYASKWDGKPKSFSNDY